MVNATVERAHLKVSQTEGSREEAAATPERHGRTAWVSVEAGGGAPRKRRRRRERWCGRGELGRAKR